MGAMRYHGSCNHGRSKRYIEIEYSATAQLLVGYAFVTLALILVLDCRTSIPPDVYWTSELTTSDA